MSIENHPHFHAAGFTADVMNSFYHSLRGSADKSKIDDQKFKALIVEFVIEVEELVDESAVK